jgi:hypothetical protein
VIRPPPFFEPCGLTFGDLAKLPPLPAIVRTSTVTEPLIKKVDSHEYVVATVKAGKLIYCEKLLDHSLERVAVYLQLRTSQSCGKNISQLMK